MENIKRLKKIGNQGKKISNAFEAHFLSPDIESVKQVCVNILENRHEDK